MFLTIEEKAQAYDQLRELMGHVGNGSETPVTLSQDDVTGSFVVSVGSHMSGHRFRANDLASAIHLATTGE